MYDRKKHDIELMLSWRSRMNEKYGKAENSNDIKNMNYFKGRMDSLDMVIMVIYNFLPNIDTLNEE